MGLLVYEGHLGKSLIRGVKLWLILVHIIIITIKGYSPVVWFPTTSWTWSETFSDVQIRFSAWEKAAHIDSERQFLNQANVRLSSEARLSKYFSPSELPNCATFVAMKLS